MRTLITTVLLLASTTLADNWKTDSTWHDGLVEKAVYSASRPIYGKDRKYEAIIFTNKEQHDLATLTKSEESKNTVEVFKHNHIEVIPTPNYDYKFATTSHFTVDKLELTRLDSTSQEFCGTSFKQFTHQPGAQKVDYWAFSYMPENGRVQQTFDLRGNEPTLPQDGLPLTLRDYDFSSRPNFRFWLLPTQKITRNAAYLPVAAEVRYAGEDGDSHKLEVHTFAPTKMAGSAWDQGSKLLATYWFAKDQLHVMTRAKFEDGQTYRLKSLDRVNYWTIKGE